MKLHHKKLAIKEGYLNQKEILQSCIAISAYISLGVIMIMKNVLPRISSIIFARRNFYLYQIQMWHWGSLLSVHLEIATSLKSEDLINLIILTRSSKSMIQPPTSGQQWGPILKMCWNKYRSCKTLWQYRLEKIKFMYLLGKTPMGNFIFILDIGAILV